MKILFCSDIHGNSDAFEKVVKFFQREAIDQMIILGDLFSSSYDISSSDVEIEHMLWEIKDQLKIVEGNCDAKIAYDLSPVGFLKKYSGTINDIPFLCYHGHIPYYDSSAKMIIQGHSHVCKINYEKGIFYLNPGSVGHARDYTHGSFMVITKEAITIYNLDGLIVKEYNLNKH